MSPYPHRGLTHPPPSEEAHSLIQAAWPPTPGPAPAHRRMALHVTAAGCEWLHADFEDHLAPFCYRACGFRPTPAGLIHLPTLPQAR